MRKAIMVWCLALCVTATPAFAQSNALLGSATQEASRPYPEFSVRLRNITTNDVVSQPLSTGGTFRWENIAPSKYTVELLNKKQEVVCTEGPFEMRANKLTSINVDCGKVPAAWWLVGAAAAAGVTAGVVALAPASPSR